MNIDGIVIGLGTFFIIGILHPVVIKVEFYFSKKCWPLFLIAGMLCSVGSLFINNHILSVLSAVLGFSLFWSIHELYQQENRVKKGWYPAKIKQNALQSSDN